MIKLEHVPNGLQAIIDWYGGPPAHVKDGKLRADIEWAKKYTKRIYFPYPMHLTDGTIIISQYCHVHIADALLDALRGILDFYGLEYLQRYNLDHFGGLGSTRLGKGREKELSTHAWYMAIDLCTDLGPWEEPSRMPWPIVNAFLKRRFVNFPHFDGMHFQGARNY